MKKVTPHRVTASKVAQSEQIWPPNLMFFIVVRISRRPSTSSPPPHPPVSVSARVLQLLVNIPEMGYISPGDPPVFVPCLGFLSQGSRHASMGGGGSSARPETSERCPWLAPEQNSGAETRLPLHPSPGTASRALTTTKPGCGEGSRPGLRWGADRNG